MTQLVSRPTQEATAVTAPLRVLLVDAGGDAPLPQALLEHRRVDPRVMVLGRDRLGAIVTAAREADLTVVVGGGPRGSVLTRALDLTGRRSVRYADLAEAAAGGTDRLVARLAVLAHRPGAALPPTVAVSVVVTVLNEAGQVDALVDALQPQLRPGDELVVVDGGSTDGTAERLAARATELPAMTVLSRPGTNISAGRNQGIAVAANPVIACTDAGCTPAPDWLDALRVAFADEPRPGLVASIPLVEGATALQDAQALACYPHPDDDERPSLLVRLYGRIFGQVFTPSLPFARSLAFTKQAWAEVGGFPEALGWVEDGVFGLSVAERHAALTTRDARLSWTQRGTLRSTAKMYQRYGIGAAQSGNRSLIMRDAARVAAYAGSLAVLSTLRRRAVLPVAAGAAAYYSLPVVRVLRSHSGWRALALVPVAMAVKDFSKVAGEISAHAGRRAALSRTRR